MPSVHEILCRYTIGDGYSLVVDQKKSKGSWLVDANTGKPYLDCSSQYGSQALGWNHPALLDAQAELGRAALHKIANSDFYSKDYADFAEAFAGITPDFQHYFFIDGGTLGVENALKAAFDWKSQLLGWGDDQSNDLDVIHLQEAFHGRSGYTLSLTNTVPNKTERFPKFKWTRISSPKINFSEGELGLKDTMSMEQFSLDLAEVALKRGNVAAIILEPIQAEGGDNHFRPEFHQSLRSLADCYQALLIYDEVQTGIGITGKMWAYQHYGVTPDLLCFGKKTQVCGVCSTGRIDSVPNNVFKASSRINSTWGGNIVDMVRFTHIIRAIERENLVNNAQIVGDYFLNELKALPRINNVRGRGLMLAFDLEDGDNRNAVLNKLEEDMLALPCGTKSIRLRPHLTLTKGDVDVALIYLKKALS